MSMFKNYYCSHTRDFKVQNVDRQLSIVKKVFEFVPRKV